MHFFNCLGINMVVNSLRMSYTDLACHNSDYKKSKKL